MAARRQARNGGDGIGRRRNGTNKGTRQRSGSSGGNSKALLYAEIFGAAALAVILLVVFGSGKTNKPPKEQPKKQAEVEWRPVKKKVDKTEEFSKKKFSWATPKNLDGEPGIPPTKPVPKVDMEKGNKLFREAQALHKRQEVLRTEGRAGEARKLMRQAYEKLEEAIASVEPLDHWIMHAQLEGWAVGKEVRQQKKTMDRWYKLRAIIHKVLPKTD